MLVMFCLLICTFYSSMFKLCKFTSYDLYMFL